MKHSLPIIDLHDPEDVCSQKITEAAETYGFFYVKNHAISNIEMLFELGDAYFDLPLDEKKRFGVRAGQSGYVAVGQERLDAHNPLPEPKEAFNFRFCGEALPDIFASRTADIEALRQVF